MGRVAIEVARRQQGLSQLPPLPAQLASARAVSRDSRAPRFTTMLRITRSQGVRTQRGPPVASNEKCLQVREADARIRTADPFITRERPVGDARPLAGTRGRILTGNQLFHRRQKWTRVPARPPADVPVCTRPRRTLSRRARATRLLLWARPCTTSRSSRSPSSGSTARTVPAEPPMTKIRMWR
jgi:hypothetical protein